MAESFRFVLYACVLWVIAGSGPAYAQAPALVSAVSRKAHGPAGTFDLPLPVASAAAVEPRDGPTFTIILCFDRPIVSGDAVVTRGIATIAAPPIAQDDELTVTLSGVSNGQVVTIEARNVLASGGGALAAAPLNIRFLEGDVSGNAVVSTLDVNRVKAQVGQPVTSDNFLLDISINGQLSTRDVNLAKARAGTTVPNTPPTLTDLLDAATAQDTSLGPLPFEVLDAATPPESLAVTVASNNRRLVPAANLVLAGSGRQRTLTVTPAPQRSGQAEITLTVSDGALTMTDTFTVIVEPAPIPPGAPVARFTTNAFVGQAQLTVAFDARASFDPDGSITSYAWTFDGAAASGPQISRTFAAGEHLASLTVTDTAGNTDTEERVITVSDGTFDHRDPPTPGEAGRFLWQAAFGPTPADVQRVASIGYQAWIDEQINEPPTFIGTDKPQAWNPGGDIRTFDVQRVWSNVAVDAPDQLRQRVAYALSQVLVLNIDQSSTEDSAAGPYYDHYIRNALGNYRQLLEDITFTHSMGVWLTYRNNRKADDLLGTSPDENYAREVMQLFSIGLWELNPDGTRKLDSDGHPIPTYDNERIREFARIFTGLATDNTPGLTRGQQHALPMRMVVGDHDFGQKQLLDYPGAIPAGGVVPARAATVENGVQDIRDALDNIFHHPNCPPFIARLLIQRLTASNPSPAYVQRAAAAFAGTGPFGSGTRGDLAATVRAILLDPEARDPAFRSNPLTGRLQEPIVLKWGLNRVLNVRDPFQPPLMQVTDDHRNDEWQLGQKWMRSPSVFNFYLPDYSLPNSVVDRAGLTAPEFQVFNEVTATSGPNEYETRVAPPSNPSTYYALWEGMAGINVAGLVDAIDDMLLYGTMSPELRATITDAVTQIDAAQRAARVRVAVWLTVVSPEFVVLR